MNLNIAAGYTKACSQNHTYQTIRTIKLNISSSTCINSATYPDPAMHPHSVHIPHIIPYLRRPAKTVVRQRAEYAAGAL